MRSMRCSRTAIVATRHDRLPAITAARLAAGVEVSALIRRISAAGGNGMVVAKGDPQAGAILLWLADRGHIHALLERRLLADGRYGWEPAGPKNIQDYQEVDAYIRRRRDIDGDLWVIELDIAGVERFAAELIATG